MRKHYITIGVLTLSLVAPSVLATCKIASRSDNLVLMNCAVSTTSKEWVEASKLACDKDTTCNVWIWGEETLLPTTAPKTDSEIPKSLTSKALAVWANDSASLLTLKAKNK